MQCERWMPVPDTEGVYEVSSLGRVRSKDTIQHRFNGRKVCEFRIKGKLLKPIKTGAVKNGTQYLVVEIARKQRKIHRLVAEAFIPNTNNYPFVNHIDGNKENNRVDNLEWCSSCMNTEHAFKSKLAPSGETVKNHKLSEADVAEIRNQYTRGNSCFGAKPLARKYGVSSQTIRRIVQNKKWRFV